MNMLGERLRRERVRRKEKQVDTGARFGISQPSYCRWEAGSTVPEPKHYSAVADFLGCTTEEVWELIHGDNGATSLAELTGRVDAVERDIIDLKADRPDQTIAELRKQIDELSSQVAFLTELMDTGGEGDD